MHPIRLELSTQEAALVERIDLSLDENTGNKRGHSSDGSTGLKRGHSC